MSPAVVAEEIEVTYPGQPPVAAVRGVSLTVEAGEFIAIVGPSGSGKTSLLYVLGALLPPSCGAVTLVGTQISQVSERMRNAVRAFHVGFVFQEFHLIAHRSVVDNVMIGSLYQHRSLRARHEAAFKALAAVGIEHLADSSPRHLSGGERQRVGIARALASEPTLLLCDEPTGNLDTMATLSILELLCELQASRGLTIVVATHDPEVQSAAGRSVRIVDGRLA